jgi:aryl-alcohol dehydrogenase-like predicted oxidoreductase
VDRGLNWIDTAPVYGLGHSEEVVGRALADIPAADRPYVFTKCSLVWDDKRIVSHNLNPASIRREVEASLRRLQTERIDLYQIHWPAWPASPPGHNPGSIEEAWDTMAALRREGKVAWIGVSNFDVSQLGRIDAIERPTSLQPPYSLLRREIEQEVLPYCVDHNIGVISYAPMQSGLLTGKMTRERLASLPDGDFRRNNKFFQEPVLSRALALVERLRDVGARHGRAPGEAAIAWVLNHPAITAAIVGARRPDQLDGIVGAGSFTLSAEEAAALEG